VVKVVHVDSTLFFYISTIKHRDLFEFFAQFFHPKFVHYPSFQICAVDVSDDRSPAVVGRRTGNAPVATFRRASSTAVFCKVTQNTIFLNKNGLRFYFSSSQKNNNVRPDYCVKCKIRPTKYSYTATTL